MAKKMRKDAPVVFSYKEVKTLLRYISPVSGQIEPISKTLNCSGCWLAR